MATPGTLIGQLALCGGRTLSCAPASTCGPTRWISSWMPQDESPGHRDATMILLAFWHGLRAAELVDLRCEQIDFTAAAIAVRPVKNGSVAPATGQ
jgi:hypothetical protein